MGPLVQHTARTVEAGEIDVRLLANVAYGMARISKEASFVILFVAVAKAGDSRMCEFKPRVIANTAWAFATAKQLGENLFTALAKRAG